MDHKYKEEKYIIKAKMLFAKYTLTGEKMVFFAKIKWAKQGFKILWVSPIIWPRFGRLRPQTRKKHNSILVQIL